VSAASGPDISVIIPCHNAAAVLPRTLSALAAQDLPGATFEVVVVDDGSTDGSAEAARAWRGPVRPRVTQQPNRGLAAARNRGADDARGEVLLFLDADVLACPTLLAQHLRHHQDRGAVLAVQGRTVPDPETLTNLFVRLSAGPVATATPRPRQSVSPLHVVGRNLSVTVAAHRTVGGFDEGFVGYGFEDVEYALRIRAAGGRIADEPRAVGLHHHPLTIEAAIARQRENGRAAVYFWRRHGRAGWLGLHLEIHPTLLPLKRLVYGTGAVPSLARRIRPWAERRRALSVLNECYNILLWDAYYQGVFEALRRGTPGRAAAGATSP
jgi:GT2 family glycosyltransferase